MRVPKPISKLIESFERLPGIGPKTAQRLTFFLLHFPQEELQRFADALTGLKTGTKICSVCKNIDEVDPCSICSDKSRDNTKLIVVSNPMDVFAFEKVGYKGLYHVLHGVINPLNNIGPEELYIKEIVGRIRNMTANVNSEESRVFSSGGFTEKCEVIEIILATNTSMEGESTAMYISKLLRDSSFGSDTVKITRIARGLPVGGDIEYADDITLSRALEGRSDF